MALYKTIPLDQVQNRTTNTLSAEDSSAVRNTVTNFITYLKAKHS